MKWTIGWQKFSNEIDSLGNLANDLESKVSSHALITCFNIRIPIYLGSNQIEHQLELWQAPTHPWWKRLRKAKSIQTRRADMRKRTFVCNRKEARNMNDKWKWNARLVPRRRRFWVMSPIATQMKSNVVRNKRKVLLIFIWNYISKY